MNLNTCDPVPLSSHDLMLPNAWPDLLNLQNPINLLRLLLRVIGPRAPVKLPEDFGKFSILPEYLLKEFHRIPNGNFSHRLTAGYASAFDSTMWGKTHGARRKAAAKISGARSALDLGCGNGALGGAFQASGIEDVWGLDASPYLLKQAIRIWPTIKFVHGLAETTHFPSSRFDAVGACFLFHELPAAIADQVLAEVRRILRPNGILVIIEPSPLHRHMKSLFGLLRLGGLAALYFHALSRFVYEPYVSEWHANNPSEWFLRSGFKLMSDETEVPFQMLTAAKL